MQSLPINLALVLVLVVFAGCSIGCDNGNKTGNQPPLPQPAVVDTTPVYSAEIINTFQHDTSAFTQGLVFHDGALYESTGLEGQSSLRKVEVETGKVLKKVDVAPQHFAEGLALYDGRLYQITWRSQLGLVYDLNSFQPVDSFSYFGEGWGLTTDGVSLIMSDGTNFLRFIDPKTLQVTKTLGVYSGANPLERLNELEFVNGEIYANIWTTDRIARIDPVSGQVKGWIDLANIYPVSQRIATVDVLNGIAYDPQGDRLFVTGKKWPSLYEIKLKRREQVAKVPA